METKTCFLFAGQGSQYPGMGEELAEFSPACACIFEAGSDILGFNLKDACLHYSAEELSQTEVSQPAILAVSLAAFKAVQEKTGLVPSMVAGHSLGEYAAMAACGILSLENVFRVIQIRARAMGKCAKKHPGGMCAVINASQEEIAAACQNASGYVTPVNYNSPVQTVIAGEENAVNAAAEQLSALKKRCIKLSVSAAFHSKFMEDAAKELESEIQNIPFSTPKCDFYSNVTGQKLTDFSDLPKKLAKHLVSPVQFVSELNALQKDGAARFVECGPGKVLTGLVRKTLSDVSYAHVEDKKTLASLCESLS